MICVYSLFEENTYLTRQKIWPTSAQYGQKKEVCRHFSSASIIQVGSDLTDGGLGLAVPWTASTGGRGLGRGRGYAHLHLVLLDNLPPLFAGVRPRNISWKETIVLVEFLIFYIFFFLGGGLG